MSFFRFWILPPLVGGIIGWFTNWLAIKMLFRPLKEWRIFGLPVPFTPGILPRGRARLASSIGEMVAAELFTADILRARMAAPEVFQALERGIGEGLSEAGSRDAGETLAAALDAAEEGPLAELSAETWRRLAASPAFAGALEASIATAMVSLEAVPLSVVLPPEGARDIAMRLFAPDNAERLRSALVRGIESIFDVKDSRTGIQGGAGSTPGLLTQRDDGGSMGASRLADLIPPEVLEPIVRALSEGLYRAAVPGVESLLGGPGMRRSMEEEARGIVHGAIERLGLVQRLFVGLAGYERKLSETMPETLEDLVASISRLLRDPAMPGRVSESAIDAFSSMAREPLSRAASGILSREAAFAAADALVDALRDHGPALAGRAAELATAGAGATIGGFMGGLGISSEALARDASRSLATFLSGQSIAGGESDGSGGNGAKEGGPSLNAASARFAEVLASGLRGTSLGELTGLDEARRKELSSWLARRAIDLVAAQTERILEGVDIRAMVVDRIDELEMIEVERLILGIVDRELLWITIIGGVLGAAIGLIQSLLALLH
ncbi:MAG TPA: DUF445 family protein [Rectinemataceae bacterium]|nr:DUF445 family protein [Rectinemataceae bacterium]